MTRPQRRLPDAWLVTWRTGNQTATAGSRKPPSAPGVVHEPLFKDNAAQAALFEDDGIDYEAAADKLAMLFDGCPLMALPAHERGHHRRDARAIVQAALSIPER